MLFTLMITVANASKPSPLCRDLYAVFSSSQDPTDRHIDRHLTTTRGCDVHIVGELSICCPPSFTGTVTVGPPCAPVSYVFRVVAPESGGVEYGGGPSSETDFNAFIIETEISAEFAQIIRTE